MHKILNSPNCFCYIIFEEDDITKDKANVKSKDVINMFVVKWS